MGVGRESSGYHLARVGFFSKTQPSAATLCGLGVARAVPVLELSEATCRECKAHARKQARS